MTSTTTAPGTGQLLRRACAAEWTRLWTVRTTWWCLLAAAVTIVGMATLLGFDAAGTDDRLSPWPPAHVAGELGLMPGQLALLVLVVLAVTSEYATGAIGTTLQWTPHRGLLLVARVAVPAAVATFAGVALVLLADLVAWAIAPPLELTASGLAGSLLNVAGVLVGGTLLALGLAFAVRSTAGAVASVAALMLVLPLILPLFGVGWLVTVAAHLPGGAALSLLDGEIFDVTRTTAIVTLVVWVAVALTSGTLSLLRRDAT